jgi:enoyl-CoA hydratase
VSKKSLKTVSYETRGPVGILTLNRPEVLNAIDAAMIKEINGVLDGVEADEAIRALILRGEGRAFSSGFDLKAGEGAKGSGPGHWRPILERDFDMIMRFWRLSVPTIAAVHGYCLAGACEMALACDITIAGEGARFGEPELKFGSGIVAMLLPWITGPKQAKEIILTGQDRLSASRALDIGLINKVVPDDEVLDSALAMARDIAVMDRQAVILTKRAINRSYEISGMNEALAMALDIDVEIESLETPEGKKFSEIAASDGLKAAIAWRDSRFGSS